MMLPTFSNHRKNFENNDNKETLSPYKSSPTWAIESFFIDIYSLLAHRIKGLGWSLSEFWKCDTWTTSKLYCMELDLIEEEEKAWNNNNNTDEVNDSDEMKDLYLEMWGDEQ